MRQWHISPAFIILVQGFSFVFIATSPSDLLSGTVNLVETLPYIEVDTFVHDLLFSAAVRLNMASASDAFWESHYRSIAER